MTTFRSTLRRHPLVAFFVLAYALTWAAVPFGGFFPPGALLAAVTVVALTTGRAGLAEMGRRLLRWRVSWRWYAVAVALPLSVAVAAVALNLWLGAGPVSLAQLTPASGLLMVFAVRLINPLDGPVAEEPGWRAYAQPALQHHRSPLAATAILGLLVAGWHLPLWLLPQFGATGMDIACDFGATIAVTFWYAWLFNHTGGSALLTLVAHAAEGVLQISAFWASGPAAERAGWLYAGVWCVVAVILLLADPRAWRLESGPAVGARRELVAADPSDLR